MYLFVAAISVLGLMLTGYYTFLATSGETVLEGATTYGADDHNAGKVDYIHGSGATSTEIIDVGGFLGIGAKPFAVPSTDLELIRNEDGEFHSVTAWMKDQLKQMPGHRH